MTEPQGSEHRPDYFPEPYLWEVEPAKFALDAATARRMGSEFSEEPPLEVGRRLLLAQFVFNEWVLRRVERVQFTDERSINREVSIELRVREDAPTVLSAEGKEHWLVPLTFMRQRTMANLDIRDEHGLPINLLGLRFTQKLDEAMLKAAASFLPEDAGARAFSSEAFIHAAVSGDWREKRRRRDEQRVAPEPGGSAAELVYRTTLQHLRHNFTLYVALPVELGRRRLIRMSFDDATNWKYQYPELTPGAVRRYRPLHRQVRYSVANVLGIQPVRIRLLTPSAENAASYHFEFTAPDGLHISKAALLAGRPNEARDGVSVEGVSVDTGAGGTTVGLHAVEIPNGSLCRVQLDLRLSRRGWLGALLACCVAVSLVVAAVLAQTGHVGDDQWRDDQVTNMILFLVTVSAGSATYVAAAHPSAVTTRLLSKLRMVGVAAVSLPALTAGALAYLGRGVENGFNSPLEYTFRYVVAAATLAAVTITFLVALTYLRSRRSERRDERRDTQLSPWDQADTGDPNRPQPYDSDMGFEPLMAALEFNARAIGVESSEGWHDAYGWSAERQLAAVGLLEAGRDDGDPSFR
ncbi:hypothetical protein [Aeromicrobium wangtongii]|uniref:hypothetical protein n=1 Tax=Aeromicrobium wangtongii TaxID=2969247 RepID=UPI00201777E8|nr:hypothetical protein [Aeromicrobium wangtongii]MCL3819530.1 hypothetical protein [Aeromicrobium wangtongii]